MRTLLLLICLPLLAFGEVRTWTPYEGEPFKGELTWTDGLYVKIKMEDGKEVKQLLGNFSSADFRYVRDFRESQSSTATPNAIETTKSPEPLANSPQTLNPITVDGFNGCFWGSSRQDIIDLKGEPMDSSDRDWLFYTDKIGGYEVVAGYRLLNDRLVKGKFVVLEEWVNKNNYLNCYQDLSKKLTTLYGERADEKIFWSNDLYKNDVSQWGFAISAGHHSRFLQWTNQKTRIDLVIYGEKFKVNVMAEYTFLPAEDYLKKEAEKEELSGL